jgi:SH3 domain-containing YSC84-like protein 1
MIHAPRGLLAALAMLVAVTAMTGAMPGAVGTAFADTPQQRVVDRARHTVETFLDDRYVEDIRPYVQNAYGVLIIPDLLKGGLFLGAEHGVGVLLVRDVETGRLGPPAFYDIYGISLGLQIGGKASQVLLTIMNPGAIDRILQNRFKLGADASVAAGRVGAGVGAATTARFGEDIYLFSRDQGLFGGLALEGSMVLFKEDWNEGYYGRTVSAGAIVRRGEVDHPGTHALREALLRF